MIKQFNLISKFNKLPLSTSNPNQICDLLFRGRSSFVMGIVGKPGCGKSVIIQELLLNSELLKDFFEYVVIFSPSKFEHIDTILNQNWFSEFSPKILFQSVDILAEIIEEKGERVRVLYIFDDFITSIKDIKNSSELMRFFYNRRHLLPNKSEISIVLTSQRYVVIPTNYRSLLSDLIFFKLNDKDYKFIKEDSVGALNVKEINSRHLTNDHDFVYISLTEGIGYKNFVDNIKLN